jgi:hypothetical protein
VITSEPWGAADGQAVELYALSGGAGMTVRDVESYEVALEFGR